MQDEACTSLAGALLYHGGFHSLQLQRVAHAAWQAGQKTSALRISVSRRCSHTLLSSCPFADASYLAFVLFGMMAMHGEGSSKVGVLQRCA